VVVIMLCAEINVATSRRLLPRSLLTPSTDDVEPTEADQRVYHLLAQTQRFKGFETVHTEFTTGALRSDRRGPTPTGR
jgi:membrane protein